MRTEPQATATRGLLIVLVTGCALATVLCAGDSNSPTPQRTLKEVTLPRFVLDNASPDQALKSIARAAKKHDPDHGGINLVYRAPDKRPRTRATASDKADGNAAQKTAGGVSMDLRNVTLGQVLRLLCDMTELKYRVTETAVIIVHESVPLDETTTRVYRLRPSVAEDITSGQQ